MPNLDIVHEELNNNYFHRDSFQAGHVIMTSVEYEVYKERLKLAPEDFIVSENVLLIDVKLINQSNPRSKSK